ncbi:MAG TPA: Gfo/Idh/MocA family oxidoreductase [Vicinamibacterales bacterium]
MTVSRRTFLSQVAATAAAAPFIITSRGLAQARKVRHASIGASGMALADIRSFMKHPAFELVAVADVDLCVVPRVQELFPKVRVYQDWRELLKKEKNHIDSVNVSTPDHMHAAIAAEAMRQRKHVYVQKPLAATVRETRLLTELARKQRVVSQMGIQVSSSVPQRLGEAMVRSGVIGKVKEVHTFSNKSWGLEGPAPEGSDPVPPALDWDGWLGVAEERPYRKGAYHPGQWRRCVDFGTGTLGDMGCHIFSPPYRALALTAPVRITSHGPAPTADHWPVRTRVHYVYPGTEYTEGQTVDVTWYDGSERPPARVLELTGGTLPDQGTVFIGTAGTLVLPHGGDKPLLYPEEKFANVQMPQIEPRDHYAEFLDAVLSGGECSTKFDYSGPLTESVLLGNVAAWFPGETLELDAARLRFTNKPEADARLTRRYRKGWKVDGIRS